MAMETTSLAAFTKLSPMLQLVLPLVALVVLNVFRLMIYNVFFHPLRHVPGPKMAALSSLWAARQRSKSRLAHKIKAAHEVYGPVIRIAPNELHFASPSALKQVYPHGRDSPRKGTFYKSAQMVNHDNLFTFIDKEAYAARKKIIAKCFSQNHLVQFLVGVRKLTSQLGDRLATLSKESDGNVLDLYGWMVGFTFEAMYVMCFNEDAGMMRTGKPHALLNDMELSNQSLPLKAALPILRHIGHLIPIPAISKLFRAAIDWYKFTLRKVEEARLQHNKTSFLARLTDTPDDFLGRPLTLDEATEEVMGLMFAGSGTTAVTMITLIYQLAKIPEFQTRLHEELSTLPSIEGGVYEYQDVRSLPLLQALINETLRYHPAIVGVLPRIAEIDMVVQGVAVPRGTQLNMSNLTHHFDASIYTNPEEFNPDRWLGNEKQSDGLKASYSPFGVGPRNCIGQSYSICEMQILVAMLVSRFTFALTPKMQAADMSAYDFFTGIPKAGILEVVVKERV